MTNALYLEKARTFQQRGKLAEAERLLLQILGGDPGHAQAAHLLAILRFNQDRDEEALRWITVALRGAPDSVDALAHRAMILQKLARYDDALAAYEVLVAVKPDHAEGLNNRGIVLRKLGRFAEAVASYDAFLAHTPDNSGVLFNRALALGELNRFEDALASLDQALAIKPSYVKALARRGEFLRALGRLDEALASYDRALWVRPADADALYGRAGTLHAMKRFADALAGYEKLLVLAPDRLDVWADRGSALRALRRLDEALTSYDKILELDPGHVKALNNRGNVLCEMNRFEEALASYDRILAARPDHAEVWSNRAGALSALKRYDAALADLDKVVALDPDHVTALGHIAGAVVHNADWKRIAKYSAELETHVAARKSVVDPLIFMSYCDDPALQRRAAETYARHQVPARPRALWNGTPWRHEKIRIGYLSADFGYHPVGRQMAEIFERHDRARFEIHGISLGPDDGSDLRARLVRAFDRFHDLHGEGAGTAAQLAHALEIDILVDLNGHTRGGRPEILAHRPAPVAVNFLGYAGTMGANFVDYIIADPVVLPFEQADFFAEKIVHLPDSYMPNDSRRPVAAEMARSAAGLPESPGGGAGKGFVFCSFNNHWKINAGLFDVWMRLLGAVPGSVLWLKQGNESLAKNLRDEATARGIDAARLIFADAVALDEYLARFRLADLFLDTLPYNAHATACDALWAGLPVITVLGRTFPGRVAASLLHAIGAPELATANLQDYETLALALARDPARLAALRVRLDANRASYALFDARRFARNLEAAFTKMWEIAECGERPQSFAVAPNAIPPA